MFLVDTYPIFFTLLGTPYKYFISKQFINWFFNLPKDQAHLIGHIDQRLEHGLQIS